jgi:hypothetical protein
MKSSQSIYSTRYMYTEAYVEEGRMTTDTSHVPCKKCLQVYGATSGVSAAGNIGSSMTGETAGDMRV